MKLQYGDKIIIKGETRVRKVLTEDNEFVYYGSFGDKVKKENIKKVINSHIVETNEKVLE